MEQTNNQIMTTVYIVRHGQTEWNLKGLLQGHGDSPLTPEGEKQARAIAQELKHVHFDEIFASDLLRAKRTAQVIALEKKIAIKTTQALRERNYGIYEGKPYTKYNKALEELLLQYKHLNENQLSQLLSKHGVESIPQSVSRFITFLREMAVGFKGKTILIVTHGGLMRHLLTHLGFGTHKTLPPGSISNTGYIKLESDGVDFFVQETKGINKPESIKKEK